MQEMPRTEHECQERNKGLHVLKSNQVGHSGAFTLRGVTEKKPTTSLYSRGIIKGYKRHSIAYCTLLKLRYTTMPQKRKSRAEAGQVGRIGRSKRMAVDDSGSSTRTPNSPSLDPLARMNRDVVSLILHYLSPRDLTWCECVCKGWREIIHWWVAAFGFRVHFPHIIWDISQVPTSAIWEAFKVQGGYLFGLLHMPCDASSDASMPS
jgi:hypothetical protein